MSKEIKTDLSLSRNVEDIVSDVQKEILKEEIEELSPIKENDINISTIYVFDDGEDLEAKVYFRNGLSREVNFEDVPLILVNSRGEQIAQQVFDLRELGNIPSCAARPWKLYFTKSLVDMDNFAPGQCRVLFHSALEAVHYEEIEFEDFPEDLIGFRSSFEKFLSGLPKMKRGQVSFSTFNISLNTEGNIVVTIIVRNSNSSTLRVEKIPAAIKDESGNLVASGKFVIKDFLVSPRKAKILNLAFQTSLSTEDILDLSNKWYLVFE